MRTMRRNAVVAGVLFIIATGASLLSGPLLASLDDSDYLVSIAAHDVRVEAGALLGLVAALAAPGIAISLYPVLRPFGEGRALGAVGFRLMEGTIYAINTMVVLSLVTLSRDFVAAGTPDQPHYRSLGDTVLAAYRWMGNAGMLLAFSLGALLYYLVFYQAELIPRWLSAWGIAGVVLLMLAAVLVIFRVIGPLSATQILFALPIAVQEMVLAVWLIVKGFAPPAIAPRGRGPERDTIGLTSTAATQR